ncbi:MerR family transcriptional regulator [Actinoplanes derwentensis]|uniref:MerR family transcriptional regulator n=1 Tax=Actinoplanes derwentensis TaxID=113562 RepID=UPI0035A23EE8
MTGLLRIGELAAQAGVSTRTVDYYTQLGLLTCADRTGGGFRLYDQTAVDTIATVKSLEVHGLNLQTIATALHGEADRDLAAGLADLSTDLHALQQAAEGAPHAHALLTLISGRAHALIDLALAIVDSPLVWQPYSRTYRCPVNPFLVRQGEAPAPAPRGGDGGLSSVTPAVRRRCGPGRERCAEPDPDRSRRARTGSGGSR